VGSSRHASPSGELPFLVLPTTQEIVPLYKLHQLLVSKFEIPANSRVTAYLNLIDTKIHAAWVCPLLSKGEVDVGLRILFDGGL
jgi:hypothetical protein